MQNKIEIRGARVHNLKGINIDIPRDKLVVITGLSGSGKSSLAFDTLYAEGQRRYVESLSSYARQFLGLMDKPDVERIDGLSPAISIDQKSTTRNPRSTVGTVTEIYDYLRLLFARIGVPHCPKCGRKVVKQTISQIVDHILEIPDQAKIMLLAPVIKDKKGEHKHVIEEIKKAGYSRVRLDKNIYSIDEAEDLSLDKKKKHSLEVVIDRLVVEKGSSFKQRLSESVETALDLGEGLIYIQQDNSSDDLVFSESFSCPQCNINLMEIEPRNFSFNSPHGACPGCTGLGTKLEIDPKLIIPNPRLSLAEGAIRPWSRTSSTQTWYFRILEAVAKEHKFSTRAAVKELAKKEMDIVFYGTGSQKYTMEYDSERFEGDFHSTYEGVIPNLERRYKETDSDYIRTEIERYMRVLPCPVCQGKRLKKEVLAVTVADNSIAEVTNQTIEQSRIFFKQL
ncbi:hypothetical protein KKI23_00320, partial [Patescibacteria group bacterium]|nr:hypothetical protein [Patescibacteria group bacterium]